MGRQTDETELRIRRKAGKETGCLQKYRNTGCILSGTRTVRKRVMPGTDQQNIRIRILRLAHRRHIGADDLRMLRLLAEALTAYRITVVL